MDIGKQIRLEYRDAATSGTAGINAFNTFRSKLKGRTGRKFGAEELSQLFFICEPPLRASAAGTRRVASRGREGAPPPTSASAFALGGAQFMGFK